MRVLYGFVFVLFFLGAAPARADAFVPSLATYLRTLEREHDLSGAVLLARAGKVEFERAYGLAERNFGVKNRVDTRFNLGSMNKMFTAVAIMRLVQAGALSLDGKVADYLPDYPNPAVARAVTVAQLLDHTSGLGNYWEALSKVPVSSVRTPQDELGLFVKDPLLHAPGSAFAYSNAGYVVLGLILERVTGEDYHTHLKRTLFEPLGMNDTFSPALDEVHPRLSIGYARSDERSFQVVNNLFVSEFRGSPAGGGFSTVRDMLRFAQALVSHRLLDAEHTALITRGRHDYAKGRYAFGFSEQFIEGHRIIGHAGGHVGVACELMIFEDLETVFVYLSNGEVENYWDVSQFVKSRVVGEDTTMRSYAFTRRVIDAVSEGGLEAGRALLREGTPVLRPATLDAFARRALFEGDGCTSRALAELASARFEDADVLASFAEIQRRAGAREDCASSRPRRAVPSPQVRPTR